MYSTPAPPAAAKLSAVTWAVAAVTACCGVAVAAPNCMVTRSGCTADTSATVKAVLLWLCVSRSVWLSASTVTAMSLPASICDSRSASTAAQVGAAPAVLV